MIVYFPNEKLWFQGEVITATPNNRYCVLYEDGCLIQHVESDFEDSEWLHAKKSDCQNLTQSQNSKKNLKRKRVSAAASLATRPKKRVKKKLSKKARAELLQIKQKYKSKSRN